jgi:cell division protein ZapA
MEDKIRITVSVSERPYKVTVPKTQESLVREAAKEVDHMVKNYSKSYDYKDQQDLLAMVSIQSATKAKQLEKEKKFRDHELQRRLKALDELLTTHLEHFENRSLK